MHVRITINLVTKSCNWRHCATRRWLGYSEPSLTISMCSHPGNYQGHNAFAFLRNQSWTDLCFWLLERSDSWRLFFATTDYKKPNDQSKYNIMGASELQDHLKHKITHQLSLTVTRMTRGSGRPKEFRGVSFWDFHRSEFCSDLTWNLQST